VLELLVSAVSASTPLLLLMPLMFTGVSTFARHQHTSTERAAATLVIPPPLHSPLQTVSFA
jgi:hypothetical protein